MFKVTVLNTQPNHDSSLVYIEVSLHPIKAKAMYKLKIKRPLLGAQLLMN